MFEISRINWPIWPSEGQPNPMGQWANLFCLFQTFYKIKWKTKIRKRKCRK